MPDVDELKSRARRAEAAGDYRLALERYQKALERERETTDPEMMDPSLRLRVADLHFRLGDPDRALDAYMQASKLYARQGLIPNAIAVCNKVVGVYPDHIESHRYLAALQLEIGLTADARASLLRYVEEAAGRGRTAAARDAGWAFLEEEPDQEVAVAVAEMLAGEGRTERAMEVLRDVWERRTGLRQPAGRIETFARGLDPGVDLSEWTPVWPPPGRKRPAEAGANRAEAGEKPPAEAGADQPAEAGQPPARGVEPAAQPLEAPGTAAAVEERTAAAGPGPPPPQRHNGARTLEPEVAAADRTDGERAADPTAGEPATDPISREPTADPTADPGVGDLLEPAASGEDPAGGASATPASGDAAAPNGQRGLREGLELVEDLLEVAPDRLELHRRRVLYARRLGDLRLLERALVELGEALKERGSHRGARFVFEEVLEQLNPGSAPASEGLRRLNRREEVPGDRAAREEAEDARSDPSAGSSASSAGSATASGRKETDVDRHFRRRLRDALSASSRELAWLHAAAESCGSEGRGPVPGTSHELMGRYLLMRRRPEEATEHLGAALERSPAEGERPAELLYHLGRAWRRAGESARARDCFERLAEVDPDFRAAWAVVGPEKG